MNALRPCLPLLLVVVTACGPEKQPCECGVQTSTGTRILQCGASLCVDGAGYQCIGHGQPMSSPFACGTPTPLQPPPCTPKTCASEHLACGPLQDGCGGTLECGTCSGGARCMAGQCMVDVCAQAHAVCGTVQGMSCGTCPGTSSCSADQRRCIEKVATLSGATYVLSAAATSSALYVSLSDGTSTSVAALDLATGARTDLETGATRVSPLATNGTHLFYASSTGLHRVAAGSTSVENLTGLSGSCSSLLADAQFVYCGVGGDPRYGVDAYGIDRLPVAGGTRTRLVSFLNYPRMAKVDNLLFHIGTTDNYSSFAVLGVTDLNDRSGQSLVSGGALDSDFILADQAAYYFLQSTGSTWTLTRVPFDNTANRDLLSSTGLRRETTVTDGAAVWTIAEVNGQSGLFRLPIGGGMEKVVDVADLGGRRDAISALLPSPGGWLVVTPTVVYRVPN
ncbi:MAG: hypothetical protein ACOZQL_20785 [Myxococcota bacterium]